MDDHTVKNDFNRSQNFVALFSMLSLNTTHFMAAVAGKVVNLFLNK